MNTTTTTTATTTKVCPNYTLIDTADYPKYSEYVEYCEGNDVEPSIENSNDYWEYVTDMQIMYWNDMCDQLPEIPVIVTGTLGLWNGRHTIIPEKFDTILEAVKKCTGNADEIKIVMENGVLIVHSEHHDGVNVYYIQKLTSAGINEISRIIDNYEDIDEVKKEWVEPFEDYLY